MSRVRTTAAMVQAHGRVVLLVLAARGRLMPFASTTVRDRARARIAKGEPPCHICGKPIDYTLRSPDPMSFEVDHVVATARGGEDALSNYKAAHRRPGLQQGQE